MKSLQKTLKNVVQSKSLLAVAFVLIFAGIGSYLVFSSSAATDERTAIEPEGESSQYSGVTHRRGTVFTHNFAVNLYYEFYGGGSHPRDTNHVVVELGYKPSQTKPVAGANGLSITCNSANVTCSPVGPDRYASTSQNYFGSGGGYTRDFAVCVEFKRSFIPSNYSSTKPPVFSVTHKMVATGDYTWVMVQRWYSGTCANPTASNHGSDGVIVSGKCAYDPTVCVEDGDGGSGGGDDGSGGGGEGKGEGQGGGGGGSSATTQSNKPNSLPTTTSQGNNKQPVVTPSPFYDGKQYAPGSDPIDKTFGNISVAGHNIAHGWVYFAAVTIAVLGVAGYFWGWRQNGLIREFIKRQHK